MIGQILMFSSDYYILETKREGGLRANRLTDSSLGNIESQRLHYITRSGLQYAHNTSICRILTVLTLMTPCGSIKNKVNRKFFGFVFYRQVCLYTAFGNMHIFTLINVLSFFFHIDLHALWSGMIFKTLLITLNSTQLYLYSTLKQPQLKQSAVHK